MTQTEGPYWVERTSGSPGRSWGLYGYATYRLAHGHIPHVRIAGPFWTRDEAVAEWRYFSEVS